MKYVCTDGNADVEIEADSAREAAEEYVETGDWGVIEKTFWVDIYATDEDGEETIVTVTTHPPEPECVEASHEWASPYSLLGGCRENPGVWGHGGGIISKEVCRHCGVYRTSDTWAQDPNTGAQGLESISYDEADEASAEWIAERA